MCKCQQLLYNSGGGGRAESSSEHFPITKAKGFPPSVASYTGTQSVIRHRPQGWNFS